jgi:glycerate kinase
MKVVIAPDSFKGAISAPDAARAIARGWERVFPDAECVRLPVADGGEGTAATLAAATGGTLHEVMVTGPLGDDGPRAAARWALLGDRETAVVELAEAAGLTLVPPERRDPKHTTTRGVGELLRAAARYPGVRRVLVALGGSATNDGGAGILQALGVRLRDAAGNELPPGGAALARLASADASEAETLEGVEVVIACDVDNPLTGPRGASAVFGPQKGATPADVALLDSALAHYATVLEKAPHPWSRDTPGAGAAGGTAAGLLWAFPQAQLHPGIQIVLDATDFDRHVQGAALVLTGEGRLDAQTLGGKVVAGVARRAGAATGGTVPVGAIVGAVAPDVDPALLARTLGVGAVIPLAPGPCTLEESVANAEPWLADAAERAARWWAFGVQASRGD